MRIDPLVEEVRESRKKRAERFDFDLKKIFEDARSREANSGHVVVSFTSPVLVESSYR